MNQNLNPKPENLLKSIMSNKSNYLFINSELDLKLNTL